MLQNSPASRGAVRLTVGAVVAVAALQWLPAALAQSAPATPALRDFRADANALQERGMVALDRGQSTAALESLLDARAVLTRNRVSDPALMRNVEHAIAVAYLQQKQYDKARPYVDRSIAVKPANRTELYNLGVYDLKTKASVLRSAFAIKDHLAKENQPDEPMLILLGACLDLAVETSRTSGNQKRFDECVSFYQAALKQVNATKPGQHLWGADWITAAEYAAHERRRAEIQRQIDGLLLPDLNRAEDAVARIKAQIAAEHRRNADNGRFGNTSRRQGELDDAKARVREAQSKLNEARAKMPMPDFPKELPPISPQTGSPSDTTVPRAPEAPAEPVRATPPIVLGQSKKTPPTPEPANEPVVEPAAPVTPSAPFTPPTPVETQKVQVKRSAVAFAVAPDLLVTAGTIVAGAKEIAADSLDVANAKLELVRVDEQRNLALVRVSGVKLRPMAIADDVTAGDVSCLAFAEASIFAAEMAPITGKAARPTKPGEWFVNLAAHPRLAGAPLVNGSGQIVGVAVPTREDVPTRIPAVPATVLREFLGADLPQKLAGGAGGGTSFQITASHD